MTKNILPNSIEKQQPQLKLLQQIQSQTQLLVKKVHLSIYLLNVQMEFLLESLIIHIVLDKNKSMTLKDRLNGPQNLNIHFMLHQNKSMNSETLPQ